MARTAAVNAGNDTEQNASTLTQIREKELEVDGLVMKARAEAEARVTGANERAMKARQEAEAEAAKLVASREGEVIAEAQREADEELAASQTEVARLKELGESRRRAAVDEIINAVLGS